MSTAAAETFDMRTEIGRKRYEEMNRSHWQMWLDLGLSPDDTYRSLRHACGGWWLRLLATADGRFAAGSL